MGYRTQSLFHYTKSFGDLLKILETGIFYPNFCLEDLSTSANPNCCFGIPQVCFCDIPISKSQFLVEHYGEYAIAIRKDWGIKVGCNPIQYVSNESIIDYSVRSISRLQELKKDIKESKPLRNEKGELIYDFKKLIEDMNDGEIHNYLLGYMKKYMGKWKRKPYCNYEENEWRYVIKDGLDGIEWMTKNEYRKWRGDPKATQKPLATESLKSHGVPFDVRDIEHLIFKKEKEVFDFVEKIKNMPQICGQVINDELLHHLLTRVTSFERIKSDY